MYWIYKSRIICPVYLSGHQDIRNSFSFLLASVVPWHWWVYSKSYKPYLKEDIYKYINTLRFLCQRVDYTSQTYFYKKKCWPLNEKCISSSCNLLTKIEQNLWLCCDITQISLFYWGMGGDRQHFIAAVMSSLSQLRSASHSSVCGSADCWPPAITPGRWLVQLLHFSILCFSLLCTLHCIFMLCQVINDSLA